MRPPFDDNSPIARIGVRPDHRDPDAIVGPRRPRGSRRPHTDATVAQVRRLIEDTPLSYTEIAAKTGIPRSSISRWSQNGGWKRHPFAPRPTDTVPRERASAKLRRRTLAARLDALAERHIRELEESACVDPDKLAEALELVKMAKLATQPHRRKRRLLEEPPRPIIQLCAGGVDLHRAPRAAIDDFLANREPPAEKPPREGRRRMSRISREHRRMMERERD